MEKKNFVQKVFDLSFKTFITLDIIKIIFIIMIVFIGLGTLVGMFSGFVGVNGSVLTGIVGLILSPIVGVLAVIGARVWCELILIFFRIESNTKK
ncbi:DUF4282 domain-containing protein [bacterium]|nr:DUF4282 domain-containing protein [bacterium]